jgi:ATP-dependent Clp protease ATP-binding subunit ClpA
MDEACADMGMKDPNISEAAALRAELTAIHTEQESLTSETSPEGYARLAALRSRELQTTARLEEVTKHGAPHLTVDHLAHVIEQWTKIPASKIRAQEFESLALLEDRLKQRIVGQDEAIASVSAAIRRKRVGVGTARKPVSFLFVGPTGVGKTELVKQLALDLFDTPESLIRLDMSEFMEKHAVSRIIGAPPGYVGYDEAGQLTEKIRRKPYSVILFDEIEKAHPDVLNILLQILDDGMITDAHGRRVNFENTVLVLTSNAGSDKSGGTVGFGSSATEQSKDKAMKALKDFLRPEFINRLDEIIAFNALTKGDYTIIAGIMLKELVNSLNERGCTLTLDAEVVAWMAEKAFSPKYGARALKRLIQKELEDRIAALMIERYQTGVAQIMVSCIEDSLRVNAE